MNLDRRGFLKGSAIFAAVAGLSAVSASAQEPAKPAEAPKKDEEPKKDAKDEKGADGKPKLFDKQGREYRVCDMCGGSMYLSDKLWTCEQCGFSYEA